MATLTAESNVRVAEPWMAAAEAEEEFSSDFNPYAENEHDRLLREDPEYRAYVYRKLERGEADIAAGRVTSLEDLIAEFERDGIL